MQDGRAGDAGAIRRLVIRPTCNQRAVLIEELVGRRKGMLVQMAENVLLELQGQGLPRALLGVMEARLRKVQGTAAAQFNDDTVYSSAVESLLNLKSVVARIGGDLGSVKSSEDLLPELVRQLCDREDVSSGTLTAIEQLEVFGLTEMVLTARRRLHGPSHPSTLASMQLVANERCDHGEFEMAEEMMLQTASRRRELLGDNHPDTLATLARLGDMYCANGKLKDAEPLLAETLSTRQRTLGMLHKDTLASSFSLATLRIAQLDYAEAERLLKETLETQRNTLGNRHEDTLHSIQKLAAVHQAKGEQDIATLLSEEADNSRRQLYGTSLVVQQKAHDHVHSKEPVCDAPVPLPAPSVSISDHVAHRAPSHVSPLHAQPSAHPIRQSHCVPAEVRNMHIPAIKRALVVRALCRASLHRP